MPSEHGIVDGVAVGTDVAAVEAFISRWAAAGGAETANSQSFLTELCDLLGVPHPQPTVQDEPANRYTFEKAIAIANGDDTYSRGELEDEEILQRLVDLNAERAAEEARGHIRYLRPEFQDPNYGREDDGKTQGELISPTAPKTAAGQVEKRAWPASLPDRMRSVREVVAASGPLEPKAVAGRFKGAKKKTVAELLETLEAIGQARQLDDGRYAA